MIKMVSKKADTMVLKEVIELVIVAGLILLSVFVGYKLWGLFFGQKEDANTINNFNRLISDFDELLNSPEGFAYKTGSYYVKDDYYIFYRVDSKDQDTIYIYLNGKKGHVLEKTYQNVLFDFGKGIQKELSAEDILPIGSEKGEIKTFYIEKVIEKTSKKPIISVWVYSEGIIETRKALIEKTKCLDNSKVMPPCYCGLYFAENANQYCCKKNNYYELENACCNPDNIKCSGAIISCCSCGDKNYLTGYCVYDTLLDCSKIAKCDDYCYEMELTGSEQPRQTVSICYSEPTFKLCSDDPCKVGGSKGCMAVSFDSGKACK